MKHKTADLALCPRRPGAQDMNTALHITLRMQGLPDDPLRDELEFAKQVLEKEADDLRVCQFPKREAKFRRALAAVDAALAAKPAETARWRFSTLHSEAPADREWRTGSPPDGAHPSRIEWEGHPTESAGKSPEAVDEARIEAAYWEFDARHKGYSPFTFQRSERDAFKQTIRRMLNGGEAIP